MPKLMKCGAVIGVGAREAVPCRQVNPIRGGPVEGAVGLVVADLDAGGLQDGLGALVPVPVGGLDLQGRQAVDLLGVEDHGGEDLGRLQLDRSGRRCCPRRP